MMSVTAAAVSAFMFWIGGRVSSLTNEAVYQKEMKEIDMQFFFWAAVP